MASTNLAILITAKDLASGPLRTIANGMGALGKAAAAPTKALGGLVDGLGKIGLAGMGFQALTGAAQGLGQALGVGLNSEMEQVRASINAFTKDGALTEDILKKIRVEANSTPFAFKEMATATAALMPVAKGAKVDLMELVKQAEILAASNPMQGLEGASFSLREAMTGDFTSIIERFNLSRSTINQLKKEGVPNLEIVRRAMQEMGFDSDLIAGKAQTLEGRWSTFMDTIDTLKMKVSEPIFNAMKDGLMGLQGVLDANAGALEGFAESVAGGFSRVIETGKQLAADLTPVGQVIRGVFETLFNLENTDSLQIGLEKIFGKDSSVVGQAMDVIFEFADGLKELWTIAEDAFSGIGIIVQQALSGDVASAFENFGGLLQTVTLRIGDVLGEWANAFLSWIGPMIPPLLSQAAALYGRFAAWMTGTALPGLITQLGAWAGAFVDWVAPLIPPLLRELGGMLVQVGSWMLNTALPDFLSNLLKWGAAFVSWVAPRIPPLLIELGKLLLDLGNWIVKDAAPAIILKLGEWGLAFLDWVAKDVLPFLGNRLAEILNAISSWVTTSLNNVATEAGRLGAEFVQGIQNGIGGALDGLKRWVTDNLANALPQWVRDVLGIHSPSNVFADIGANMIRGLEVGIKRQWPSTEDLITKLMSQFASLGANIGGDATGWLMAALGITGTSNDWLPGLQKLVGLESSGNPRAVNSTQVLGQHATGLLQMLPSTFRAHMLDGLDDIFNPIHNAVASIRYIKDTYGSVYNIPGISDGREFPGYGEGGVVPNTGLAMLHQNEMVLTPRHQRQLLNGNVGGGISIGQLIIQAPSSDPVALAEVFRAELIKIARRNGYSALGGLA